MKYDLLCTHINIHILWWESMEFFVSLQFAFKIAKTEGTIALNDNIPNYH